MHKEDLIKEIAARTGQSQKAVSDMLNATIDTVQTTLAKGDQVALIGFGTFKTTARAAREGRNPSTGKSMHIPASTSPVFAAGKGLKDAVNAVPPKPKVSSSKPNTEQVTRNPILVGKAQVLDNEPVKRGRGRPPKHGILAV